MFAKLKKLLPKTPSIPGLPVLLSSVIVTGAVVVIQELKIPVIQELGRGLELLELRVYDLMLQMRDDPPRDDRLLIVAVTEDDIQKIQANSLPDKVLDELLSKIEEHQPHAIGLDIFRDVPVPFGANTEHERLLNRLKGSSIITPICRHRDDSKNNFGTSSPKYKDDGTPPPKGFEKGFEAERVGFVNIVEDTDGTIRRNLLLRKASDICPTQHSFSLQLALKYLEIREIYEESENNELKLGDVVFKPLQTDFGGYNDADAGATQIMLNYRSAKEKEIAQTVTVTEVLENKVKNLKSLIKGRIVLIGSTAPSKKDFFNTPYSSGKSDNSGSMAGVEIHAHSVSQILSVVLDDQGLLSALPLWGEVILIWGYALIGGLVAWRSQHPLWLGIVGLLLIPLLFSINFFIFTLPPTWFFFLPPAWFSFLSPAWLPFVSPTLGLVFTAGGVVAYTAYDSKQKQKEFAKLVQEQQKLIDQLQGIARRSGITLSQETVISAPGETILPDTLLNTRYKIVENLGSGGFSNTYLAVDTQSAGNPRCVVKQLRPASIESEYLELLSCLFQTEAEVLKKLGKHKQIPEFIAAFEEEQQFYIVQQFISGCSLDRELIPGQPIVQTEVINLLKEVLQVLSFIHGYGVIHRDVKPSNLIRRESDGRIILIDFGAVKQIHAQDRDNPIIDISTRGYAPPEQISGIPRLNSDIYALGMVGIQALTGVEPTNFKRDPNTHKVIVEVQQFDANPCSWNELTDADDKLVEILDRMVHLDSYRRYESATAALITLKSVY